ncbi:unnamed protein product [Brassica rapa subsp. narinosa]|uniref:DUF223 domain-containing protein n=2 Tax=Brassica TaxID=3705 RepID=M4E334_BRACM
MTICGGYEDRFRGIEKQEGKWVKIFRIDVHRAYPGFQATKSWFTLKATRHTHVHIIDSLNNRLYMDLKNIHEIPHMNHMDRNYPIVVFNTKSHFDDPARDNIESRIKCVATGDHAYAFRDSLENMRGRGQVIVVLKMWRVWRFFKTEGGLSDFRFNMILPEVEDIIWSLLCSDPYGHRHEAIGDAPLSSVPDKTYMRGLIMKSSNDICSLFDSYIPDHEACIHEITWRMCSTQLRSSSKKNQIKRNSDVGVMQFANQVIFSSREFGPYGSSRPRLDPYHHGP